MATKHSSAHPGGVGRWLSTVNHKDVGSLHLWFAGAMFFVGGALALVIRAELFQPGTQWLDPLFFNQLASLHALIMIFGVVVPAYLGLASWQIPLMIGAPDMALPRLNAWGFWLLPFAFVLLLAGLLLPGPNGPPATGWTLYPPLVLQGGAGTDFAVLALELVSISAVIGAMNVAATVLNLRAPGMALTRAPFFAWAWLVTALMLLAVTPVLAGAGALLLADRHMGTQFFDAAGGGDPRLWQHLFWFFGHPATYILILPAFGIASQIIPTFARKPLFGRVSMMYATVAIALLALISWGSHMYVAGLPLAGRLFFMFTAMLIAVPMGVVVFNWVATIWRGSLSFETPMLFALAFVLVFTLGGMSGLMLALAPLNIQYHDSYFVVAHFHTMLAAGALFAVLGGVYYWLPKWTGRMYDERLGRWHFWLSLLGFGLAFLPQHFLGLAGMPRRIPDYALAFAEFNMLSTVGAFILGLAQILFLVMVARTIRGGRRAEDRVWEGAEGLEWTLSSPPPYHSFTSPPKLR